MSESVLKTNSADIELTKFNKSISEYNKSDTLTNDSFKAFNSKSLKTSAKSSRKNKVN